MVDFGPILKPPARTAAPPSRLTVPGSPLGRHWCAFDYNLPCDRLPSPISDDEALGFLTGVPPPPPPRVLSDDEAVRLLTARGLFVPARPSVDGFAFLSRRRPRPLSEDEVLRVLSAGPKPPTQPAPLPTAARSPRPPQRPVLPYGRRRRLDRWLRRRQLPYEPEPLWELPTPLRVARVAVWLLTAALTVLSIIMSLKPMMSRLPVGRRHLTGASAPPAMIAPPDGGSAAPRVLSDGATAPSGRPVDKLDG